MNPRQLERCYDLSHEIENKMNELEFCIDDTGQIVDEDKADSIIDELNQLKGDLNQNILYLAHSLVRRKDEKKMILEREKILESRKKTLDREVEVLQIVIDSILPEKAKLADGLVTVNRRSTWELEINEVELPDEYTRPKYKINPDVPDKERIEDEIKSGKEIPGCRREQVYKLQVK